MVKAIFKRRESTERSRQYPNLMDPYVEQFRGEIPSEKIPRLPDIIIIECEKRGLPISGDWQVSFYQGGRSRSIQLRL